MKNTIIQIVLIAFVALGAISCDLELYPADKIVQEQAVQSLADVKNLRNGVYAAVKRIYGPLSVIRPEVQADGVCAVKGFTNQLSQFSFWTILGNDYDVTDLWAYNLNSLANVNFLLDNIDKVTGTEAELAEIKIIKGEMYLFRAMLMHELALKFSADYDPATAETQYGGILMLHYDPTAKPTRATLKQTYDQILDDIALAKASLTTAGAANSIYLTVDCITAFEAKVYLHTHNYSGAITAASSLIGNSKYALAADAAAFKKIWTDDTGTEIIFKFFASSAETGSTGFGSNFVLDQTQTDTEFKPDYIPSKFGVDLFSDTDIRKGAYLRKININVNNQVFTNLYVLNKYPGNKALRTNAAQNNYLNAPKVHRLADFYLIAVEACAQRNQAGDIAAGSTLLNTLRSNRISDWIAIDYTTQSDLMIQLKLERAREMYMEGTRLADLKRWGDALNRTGPQDPQADFGAQYSSMTKAKTDYMFIWPIPDNEIFANPNIEPQQNPGWVK